MIFERLRRALREQNWFSVVLEVCIVVLGVAMGFQVTAWGQYQSDRLREDVYLRQLEMDLLNTENSFRKMQPVLGRSDQSATQLVRAFRSKDAPPADSVHAWTFWAINFQRPFVVTGTVNSLLETGDINLVQNDSLRSAIIRYKDSIDQHIRYMVDNADRGIEHLAELSQRLDIGEPYLSGLSPEERDSLARVDPIFPFPEAPGRTPMPLDVDELFNDPVLILQCGTFGEGNTSCR